jgi:hypothetical protein
LEARLREDDEDDEDDEVTIRRPDGSSFTGKYRRAKRLGYVTEPDPPAGKGEDEGDGTRTVRFGRRTS